MGIARGQPGRRRRLVVPPHPPGGEWPIDRLASRLPSTSAWLLGERVLRARELLKEAALPSEDVAVARGFGTTATMRHHFRAVLGIGPVAYRDRFRAPA